MPKQPCRKPGCRNLVARGYCEACRPSSPAVMNEARRGSAAARGYGSRWTKSRDGYLRKHSLCVDPKQRHAGIVRAATDVDHIIPRDGDDPRFWDSSNWQALCHECHAYKTATEDGGFGRC
jgi:5-methylcytosine-specific restriction protein A